MIALRAPLDQSRYWGLFTLFAALAFGIVIAVAGLGEGLDGQMREWRDGLRARPASGQIVIVEIDAQSLAAQEHWPWPRRHYAEFVDRLRPANTRMLAFDVDFSSHSSPEDDRELAEALERFGGGVVLPTFRQRAGFGGDGIVESLPIPSLRKHAFLASVNVHPDPDGRMRSYSYGTVTGGVPRPSIGALLAERPGRISERFDIDFSIDPATIPRVSFTDVVTGKADVSALAGKRVIVGATAIELGDRYAVSRHGILSGVVVQALAGETLLDGSTNPSWGPWPLTLVAFIAIGWALNARSQLGQTAPLVVATVAVVGLPLVLEAAKIGRLEAAPALAMLILAVSLKIVAAVLGAFRQTRLTDAESGLPNAAALVAAYEAASDMTLVAARIGRFDEVSSVLNDGERAALISAIVDRLRIAATGGQIHRTGRDTFMWPVHADADQGVVDSLEGLSALFRGPIQLGGRSLVIKPNFGVARNTSASTSIADLVNRVGLAVARAGQKGRVWSEYDDTLSHEADRTVSLLADVDRALAEGQLWVAYQPKLEFETGRIIGAEALVRWDHPEKGAVSPAVFVPLLEAEGHAAELTLFVLDRVLESLVEWSTDGHRPSVAINVSATLLSDQAFAGAIDARVRAAGIDPDQIVIEVTESAAVASAEAAIATLEQLRAAGFSISVDDYGTGQSTLSYLKRFPANEIKIDQSFVRNMTVDPHDRILVRSTIELAHELGLKVVAEGIEDEASLELLHSFGCDLGQGWVIGRPVRAAEFIEVFAARPRAAA